MKKEYKEFVEKGALADGLRAAINEVTSSEKQMVDKKPSFRSSGIHGACVRERMFSHFLDCPDDYERPSSLMELCRMQVGTFLHYYFQNAILGPAGLLYGRWDLENAEHEDSVTGFHPGVPAVYVEDFFNVGSITGHIDGILSKSRLMARYEGNELPSVLDDGGEFIDNSDRILLEIKSTDPFVLKSLRKKGVSGIPDYYKWQAAAYQLLSGISETLFLYVDRSKFSIHIINYKASDEVLEMVDRKVNNLKDGLSSKILADRPDHCITDETSTALACPWRELCFMSEIEDIFPDMVESQCN